MLSGTDVSWGHDGRLGGSRWYGWWGRLFHMSWPATEKARLPNCVLLRLTAAARVVEEQSWRTFESAEAHTTRSERYDGHRWWKVWCMIVAILKGWNRGEVPESGRQTHFGAFWAKINTSFAHCHLSADIIFFVSFRVDYLPTEIFLLFNQSTNQSINQFINVLSMKRGNLTRRPASYIYTEVSHATKLPDAVVCKK